MLRLQYDPGNRDTPMRRILPVQPLNDLVRSHGDPTLIEATHLFKALYKTS